MSTRIKNNNADEISVLECVNRRHDLPRIGPVDADNGEDVRLVAKDASNSGPQDRTSDLHGRVLVRPVRRWDREHCVRHPLASNPDIIK